MEDVLTVFPTTQLKCYAGVWMCILVALICKLQN